MLLQLFKSTGKIVAVHYIRWLGADQHFAHNKEGHTKDDGTYGETGTLATWGNQILWSTVNLLLVLNRNRCFQEFHLQNFLRSSFQGTTNAPEERFVPWNGQFAMPFCNNLILCCHPHHPKPGCKPTSSNFSRPLTTELQLHTMFEWTRPPLRARGLWLFGVWKMRKILLSAGNSDLLEFTWDIPFPVRPEHEEVVNGQHPFLKFTWTSSLLPFFSA